MSLGQILIGCGVDIVLTAYCYFSVLHRKHSKAVSLAVYMLFAVISVAKHLLLYDHMLVRTLMQWVFIQLLFWVLFTDPLWKRFGLMVAYVGGVAVTEALTLSLLNSLGLNVVNTDESFLYSYTIGMILDALYTFFLVHLLKRRNDSFESHASRFVLMYVFIQLLLCLLLYVLIWDYGMDIVPVMLLFAFTVAVSAAFSVLLYRSMKASFAQRLKAETAEVRVSLYEEQLKRLRLQHEEYKKLRANYYRHIRTLHALGDASKRSAYIDELTKELVSDTETVFSEDEALDALLFGERLRAEQLGLRADFKTEGVESLSVPDTDICAVLSALLDEAVRRAVSAGGEAERFVSAAVIAKDGQLVINVRGSSGAEPNAVLAVVEEIAAKYDGTTVDSCDKGIYSYTFSAKL